MTGGQKMSEYHTPVMLNESVSLLVTDTEGIYADATFGGGGHSRGILSMLGDNGHLLAFDRDSEAAANLPDDKRITFINNNFRFIHNYVLAEGYKEGIHGILADLGVSSHQFDTDYRGFSFRFSAPLDMRMNTSGGQTARDIVNGYGEEELERIFRIYGELPESRKLAGHICRYRETASIESTDDMGKAIEKLLPKFAGHKFLAKVYQAIRIEVNQEMRSLEKFLKGAEKSLRSGGRIAIITYHSLEDRMVKNFLKTGSVDGKVSSDIYGNIPSPFRMITKKPVIPAEEEIRSNTRARSAKLRVAEKI